MTRRPCMPHHIRLMLVALTATSILAATITIAHANRFSVSNQQFRVVWANLEASNTAVEGTVRCPLTLEGSFHGKTITKTRGLLVGYVTRPALGNNVCTGGHATILEELLPWHLTYNNFTGTLPTITGITFNLIRDAFIIDLAGNSCKGLTTVLSPARAIVIPGAGGGITGLRIDETATIPVTNGPGGILCGIGSIFGQGTGRVTLLGTANAISVTLI